MSRAVAASAEPPAALVVAADVVLRRAASRALVDGFTVHAAEDPESAQSLLLSQEVDLAVLSADVLRALAPELARRGVPAIAIGPGEAAAGALDAGAVALVPGPPLDPAWLSSACRRALAVAPSSAHPDPLEDWIAESPRMRAVVLAVRRAAATRRPALVLGEPGSGVTFVARGLLALAPRRGPAPEEVHVDALGGGAAEALRELVSSDVDVVVVDAHSLDPAGQVALRALAASRAAPPPRAARLVVTADPSLRERARTGDFARDLFHALATSLIEVPALRDRREDLPLLAQLLLTRAAARLGRPEVRRLGADAVRALRAQPWPGHVTELSRVLEQAVLSVRGDAVLASHLPFSEGPRSASGRREADELSAVAPPLLLELPHAEAKERALVAFDRAYAEALLRRCGGNASQAARAAGMDRSNFKRLLRRARARAGAAFGGAGDHRG